MRQFYSKGTMPARNKKNFRHTKSGAGMTRAGKIGTSKKAMMGGYIGSSIRRDYDGVTLSNPSYEKYYKGMI